MKQLTVFEMETISGGYSWDFSSISSAITSVVSNGAEAVASAIISGAAHAMIGSTIGDHRVVTAVVYLVLVLSGKLLEWFGVWLLVLLVVQFTALWVAGNLPARKLKQL